MSAERKIKIVRLGDRQTFQLPPEFELPGEEVVLLREGDDIILRPVKSLSLIEYLDTLEPLDEEFPEIEDLPIDDVEI